MSKRTESTKIVMGIVFGALIIPFMALATLNYDKPVEPKDKVTLVNEYKATAMEQKADDFYAQLMGQVNK